MWEITQVANVTFLEGELPLLSQFKRQWHTCNSCIKLTDYNVVSYQPYTFDTIFLVVDRIK